MSEKKVSGAPVYNNVDLNAHNVALSKFADGETVFYLDMNPLFTDENGYLKSDETFDGVHLYADGYSRVKDFLFEHAVVR